MMRNDDNHCKTSEHIEQSLLGDIKNAKESYKSNRPAIFGNMYESNYCRVRYT